MAAAHQEPLTYLRLIHETAWRRYLSLIEPKKAIAAIEFIRERLIEVEDEGRRLDEEVAERRRQGARLASLCSLQMMRYMTLSRWEPLNKIWRRAERILRNPEEAETRETREEMEERANAVVDVIFRLFFSSVNERYRSYQRQHLIIVVEQQLSDGRRFENAVWLRYFNWITRDPGDRRPRFEVFERLSFRTRVHAILMNYEARNREAEGGEPEALVEQRVRAAVNRIYNELPYSDEQILRIRREERLERLARGTRSG
ncbi:unnamed protein product [Caenorhabditis brenneri]